MIPALKPQFPANNLFQGYKQTTEPILGEFYTSICDLNLGIGEGWRIKAMVVKIGEEK